MQRHGTTIPGGGYEYCNMGFNLTGTIVEKISGVRFDNYIRENIIKPLSLNGDYNIDSLDNTLLQHSTVLILPAILFRSRQPTSRAKILTRDMWPAIQHPVLSYRRNENLCQGSCPVHDNAHEFRNGRGKTDYLPESSAMMQTPWWRLMKITATVWLYKTRNLIPGEIMTGHTGSAYGLYSAMF